MAPAAQQGSVTKQHTKAHMRQVPPYLTPAMRAACCLVVQCWNPAARAELGRFTGPSVKQPTDTAFRCPRCVSQPSVPLAPLLSRIAGIQKVQVDLFGFQCNCGAIPALVQV